VEPKAAMANLPPLIKAYLQIGGKIADGVALDPEFKTLDILVMVEVAKVPASYQKYFRKMAGRISL
jgi:putative hemolysin